VLVVFILAFIAILVGVFAVSTGRGGEMATEQADHAPLDLGPMSPTDIALLRPPTALWGYNMQVTDEALDRIARALRDRDIEVAYLQRQLADLGQTERAGQAERAGTHEGEMRAEDDEPPRQFTPRHKAPESAADTSADLAAVDPAAVDPAVADPAAAQPAAQPAVADPAVADPAAAERGTTEPAATERAAGESAAQPGAGPGSDSLAAAEEQGW
jgi:hypothetical protein